MAVLSWMPAVLTVGLSACYEPQLRDCAVSCAHADDCAPGQVCGSDALCAAPEVAGRCQSVIASDAGASDAAHVDAPIVVDAFVPPLDAPPPPMHMLHVKVNGRGRVTLSGGGQCDYTAPGGECSFVVTPGVEQTLTAIPDPEFAFDRWQSGACAGQDETCQLTPALLNTYVQAKFMNDDDD